MKQELKAYSSFTKLDFLWIILNPLNFLKYLKKFKKFSQKNKIN